MAERSLGAGALVLIGAAGVDGTVGALDRVLALPFASTIGISGVRRVVRALGGHAAGPLGLAIDGWGPTSGRAFTREQRALLRERTVLEDGLGAISVPTTVVVGGRDRVVSPAAQRALAGRIQGARLIELPRAGHLIPHHEPERLAEIVRTVSRGSSEPPGGRTSFAPHMPISMTHVERRAGREVLPCPSPVRCAAAARPPR